MLWDPKQGKVVGLAGSGASPPETHSRDRALAGEERRFAARRRHPRSTPGAVDAWWTLHQRYGV